MIAAAEGAPRTAARYRPYAAYRESGVSWLGTVPEHWQVVPLSQRYSVELGKMLDTRRITGDHLVPYLRNVDVRWDQIVTDGLPSMDIRDDEYARYTIQIGDLLVCEGGEVGRAAFWKGALPVCGFQKALHRLRVLDKERDEPRFLFYVLWNAAQRGVFASYGNENTIAHLTGVMLRRHRFGFPPHSEQRAIADYLDRETARLDALVAAKEMLLGLLAEKRRALVARAVTRGLDPNAPLRESGIPWLGEIPAHWETERTRWLFGERDQRSTRGDEELLSVSHITGVTPRSEKDVTMFEAETTEGYKLCAAGDLVINTLWAWMGAMGVSPVDGIVSPAYHVYQPGVRLVPAYVDSLVRVSVFAQEVTRYSKGVWSSRLRLYPEGFFEVVLPVPPIHEQRAIVTYITAETAKLGQLHFATERTISLLRERRAALIAAAVEGRIATDGAA